jgi:hypothetical protein
MWGDICGTTLKSMVEVTILMIVLIPIALGSATSGLIFVNRNKVDVPNYTKLQDKKKENKVLS